MGDFYLHMSEIFSNFAAFLQARLGKGEGEPDNIPRGGATYERVADARMK